MSLQKFHHFCYSKFVWQGNGYQKIIGYLFVVDCRLVLFGYLLVVVVFVVFRCYFIFVAFEKGEQNNNKKSSPKKTMIKKNTQTRR